MSEAAPAVLAHAHCSLRLDQVHGSEDIEEAQDECLTGRLSPLAPAYTPKKKVNN